MLLLFQRPEVTHLEDRKAGCLPVNLVSLFNGFVLQQIADGQRVDVVAQPRHLVVTSWVQMLLPEVGISRAHGLSAGGLQREALPETINRNLGEQNEEEGEDSGQNQALL